MSLEEQIRKIQELSDFIKNELPIFAEQVLAVELATVVTNRVVQQGKNYLGSSFKPYSKNQTAAFRFWGKSRTQAAERKVRAISRAKGALSYSDFRELNNLRTGKKNFEFTGEMWRKFNIVKSVKTSNGFRISIGGTTPAAQEKIDANSDREGVSIVEASEKERLDRAVNAKEWMEEQANRILNDE